MGEDVPERHSCVLETRHWTIIDENGKTESVNGPGVIGKLFSDYQMLAHHQ